MQIICHKFAIILNIMRMMPYEIIAFWIIASILVFISGRCLVKLCGLEEKIELYYMAGCILAVSVAHITASVLEPMRMTFSIYKIAALCIYTLLIIAMIIVCKKRGKLWVNRSFKKYLGDSVNRFKEYSLTERAFFIVIVGFCCCVMLITMCRSFPGSDDGYYVTKIGMMIRDNTLHVTNEQASNGMAHIPSFVRADASTWCAFLALIASSFGIDYAAVAHVAIVPFILVAAMATISLISKAMFNSAISKSLFWISFFLLAITAPYGGTMTNDYWIFSYSWYGVSTIYLMVYFLIYCLLMLSKKEEYLCKTGFWIFATLAVTAAMAMEVIAVFLIPCFVLMFGLPYIVMNRHKISINAMFKISWILLPILHSCITVLTAYMNMTDRVANGGENGGFNMALSSVAAWKASQAGFWDLQNLYTVFTIICLFCIRDKKIQQFFGWSFITAIATFLNPLFYKFICIHVSTEIVYYRLYWCIPNLLIIAYCLVEQIMGLSQNKMQAVLAYGIFVIYISSCFSQGAYSIGSWTTNIKKLANEYVHVAENLLNLRGQNEEIYALVPQLYCDFVRQYSLDIVYPLGNRSPDGDFKIPGSELSYFDLYTKVYSLNGELGMLSDEEVSILKSLGTQIVVFEDGSAVPEALQPYGDVIDEQGYHYILLQQP